MPRRQPQPRETLGTWISGLVISVAVVVAYFAFWHLSPVVTFVVGCVALVVLVIAAWYYGRATRLGRGLEKAPRQPTGHDA